MRRFGVEFEICGISKQRAARALSLVGLSATTERYNHTTRSHWKLVPDASVRGGFEVVSPVLEGEEGLEAVRAAITALDDAGAKVNRNCGLHVHFDAADLGADDIKMIVARYAKFEDEIDAFMPRSRRGNSNRFCRSIKSLPQRRTFGGIRSIEGLARLQADRYFKLNLQSYLRHGTIEFRQHSGTTNAPKTLNWIKFLDAFITKSVELANNNEPTEPADEQHHFTGKSAQAYRLIAQGATIEELMTALGWQRHTVRGAVSRLRRAGANITTTRIAGQTAYQVTGGSTAPATSDTLMAGISQSVQTFYRNRTAILGM